MLPTAAIEADDLAFVQYHGRCPHCRHEVVILIAFRPHRRGVSALVCMLGDGMVAVFVVVTRLSPNVSTYRLRVRQRIGSCIGGERACNQRSRTVNGLCVAQHVLEFYIYTVLPCEDTLAI